jgi:single-strand DNA-binding protein
MDLNRATILGRLTRDPEVKTTPNGRTVTSLAVATNRVWNDQSGAKQEVVEYHNCVLWGKLADIAGQYLSKGRRVYLEGRLQTRDWTAQDGSKKYRTEIVVENMIMLDSARGGDTSSPSVPRAMESAPHDAPIEEIRVEDIPF